MLNVLSSFKDINTSTIIIQVKRFGSEIDLNRCIEATKQRLKDLTPSKERRYNRVWHESNYLDFRIDKSDINAYVRNHYIYSDVLI